MGDRVDVAGGIEATNATVDGTSLVVEFSDGRTERFNRFWLRDNAPSNGDRESLFRPFRLASIPDDLAITRAVIHPDAIEIDFSDGTTDTYPVALLLDTTGRTTQARADISGRTTQVRFDRNLDGTRRHFELLDAVCNRGYAFVTDIPNEPEATEVISSWLGPIRETDFGRVFDIITELDPFTPSQSSSALDPHTDDPYRYTPAGISVLHCVTPSDGEGGATTIVDGFAVAERIRRDDPRAFELLTTVPVPFVHRRAESVEQGAAVDLRAAAPVISVDGAGNVCGIRFHERSMGLLQLDADLLDEVYRALMLMSRLINGDEYAEHRRLTTGEAVVYDNHRVLHGRSAVGEVTSRRHLRLCTVDRDQVHSRFRRLAAEHELSEADRTLPSGSGA